jgi:hypothetical protein
MMQKIEYDVAELVEINQLCVVNGIPLQMHHVSRRQGLNRSGLEIEVWE